MGFGRRWRIRGRWKGERDGTCPRLCWWKAIVEFVKRVPFAQAPVPATLKVA